MDIHSSSFMSIHTMKYYQAISVSLLFFASSACTTTEKSRAIQSPQVNTAALPSLAAPTQKISIAIGNFDNRSIYMRGIFTDQVDRLGGQAKSILETHLQQSQYFSVLNRDNLAALKQEAQFGQRQQNIQGANYVISGEIAEFGRKEVGDQMLFGILGHGKQQVAYAKVNLNIIDIRSSEIVHSVQGAGEYALGARELLGFGSTASYDSSLNGKVIDLAIRESINTLVKDIQTQRWAVKTK